MVDTNQTNQGGGFPLILFPLAGLIFAFLALAFAYLGESDSVPISTGNQSSTQNQLVEFTDQEIGEMMTGTLMSVNHTDSPFVTQLAWDRTPWQNKGYLESNYERCLNAHLNQVNPFSQGVVCIYAGLSPPPGGEQFVGQFAIFLGVGNKVAFLLVRGTVNQGIPAGSLADWSRIGDSEYYLLKSSIEKWKCAWMMSGGKSNGHGVSPDQWLRAGASWEKWLFVKQRYNLVVPMVAISIPNPLPDNGWRPPSGF